MKLNNITLYQLKDSCGSNQEKFTSLTKHIEYSKNL